MRPQDAYSSIKKDGKSIFFALALGLLFQISVLLLLNTNFFVHDKISAAFAQLIKEENIELKIHNLKLNFPDEIRIRNIVARTVDGTTYDLNRITLKVNPLKFIYDKEIAVQDIKCAEIKIVHDHKQFDAGNLYIRNYSSKIITRCNVNFDNKSVSVSGVINKRNFLKNIFASPKKGTVQINKILKVIADFKEALNLQVFASLSDKLEIHISEGQQNPFSKLNAEIVISFAKNGASIRSSVSGNDLLAGNPQQKVSVDSFHLKNEVSLHRSEWNHALGSIELENINLEGLLQGTLPDLSLQFLLTPQTHEALLLNNSIYSEGQIFLSNKNAQEQVEGNILLQPDLCNLILNRSSHATKLLAGRSLDIGIMPSYNSHNATTFCFDVNAEKFSVLNSPEGDFKFDGIVDEDFNIFILNAFGEFGRSKATGNYYQKWSPLAYKFDIDGICFPQDLNAWMPDWWDRIWPDFEFPSETPYGKFVIEGIWGGLPGNSLTLGSVEAANFKFRNLPLTSSSISVKVDGNSTDIIAESIRHNDKSITGNLKFPRQLSDSPYFIEFDFDGEYPLNLGRDVLGPKMKAKLSDINATSIECKAVGKIFRQNTEGRQGVVKVDIRNAEKFEFHKIPLGDLKGSLDYENNILRGKFNEVKIGQGRSNLIFELNQTEQTENLMLNLSLNEVNTANFLETVSHLMSTDSPLQTDSNPSNSNSNSDLKDSSFSLLLNAQGPPVNLLQFEGTGNLQLKHKGLSQINFLGGLSSKLSKVSPIPIASLNFNKLETTFVLENEVITFSPLEITGSLSSILSEGSVNLDSGDIDLISRLKVVGNIPIPGLKQIVNLADPLSKIAQFRITGPWNDPEWKVQINPQP